MKLEFLDERIQFLNLKLHRRWKNNIKSFTHKLHKKARNKKMNVTNINNYKEQNLEDYESIRCNCESMKPIENIASEFGPKNYAECESHLKEVSNSSNQDPKSKKNKKESIKEVDLKPKESTESEVDPVEDFLKRRGNFPISLIRQYFPKREEVYTYDLLPLPFLQNLRSSAIRENSLKNEDNNKYWKEFMKKLPESQNEIISRPDDKYWRWKNYKKYVPEERTYFRKTLPIGPKLDQFGRPPMPAELNKFRVTREITLKPQKFEPFLKKGDGHKHLININKKYRS